jgi:hypothetical protein
MASAPPARALSIICLAVRPVSMAFSLPLGLPDWPLTSAPCTASCLGLLLPESRRLCTVCGATINNNQKTEWEAAMRQFMMTLVALAAFGAMVATAQAENKSVTRTARAA